MLNLFLNLDSLKITFVFMFLIIAVIYDIKYKKVPNVLNLIILIFGIFLNLFTQDENVFFENIIGTLVIFLISIIIFYFKVLGGGDLKLYISISLIIGMEKAFYLISYSLIIGGVTYLLFFIYNKKLIKSYNLFFSKGYITRMRFTHNILIAYFFMSTIEIFHI